MCEVGMLTTQLLKISKQLAAGSKSFKLTLKTKDIDFSFSTQDKEVIPEDPEHVKKKSPSQKKRDFQRKNPYLEKKLDKSHSKPSEVNNTKTQDHVQ